MSPFSSGRALRGGRIREGRQSFLAHVPEKHALAKARVDIVFRQGHVSLQKN